MAPTTTHRTRLGRWADRIERVTPPGRDRAIDVLRALCIVVVIGWHWAGSVFRWGDGGLSMPNPLHEVPAGWTFTWVLQVMPLFFVVGGWANHRSWVAARRRGDDPATFARQRLGRLTRPVLPLLAVWSAFDLAAHALRPGYDGVLSWGLVVFVPLWFIGVYAVVTALTPWTAAAVERHGLGALGTALAAIALVDVARFAADVPGVGWVNGLLVFVAAQLAGHCWSAGLVDRRLAGGFVAAGVGVLGTLSTFGPYPPSLVATTGQSFSNLLPANAMIAALTLVQTGLAVLAAPALRRWARGRRWAAVATINLLAMTLFAWHMTALVVFLGALHVVGIEPGTEATGTWLLARPIWIVGPGLVLIALVATFARFERRPQPR